MLSYHDASDRAARYAVATGDAVNLATIQATQVAEGFTPCFGRASVSCSETGCSFHEPCMNLLAFSSQPEPSDETARDYASWSLPADSLLPSVPQSAPITPDIAAFNRPVHQRYEVLSD